ncbi:MAG: hypothetical protein IPK13_00905 [Deltaproteobacteria bacterium]|nr:hypothetical protein [Deltaproteobacteria bacterium]
MRAALNARYILGLVLTALASVSASAMLMSGCQTRCTKTTDCGSGSYCLAGRCETQCFVDEDCRSPPECSSNPSACQPLGFRCNSIGLCVGQLDVDREGGTRDVPTSDLIGPVEGWDDPPGTGHAFIVNEIGIAGRNTGFNIDGLCQNDVCQDNMLWQLGEFGNEQIKQGILGGESLLLLEVAGLDEPYKGNDGRLTLKIYSARDADDPYYPSNNFSRPEGSDTCCEFKIVPLSISGPPPQARARAPARVTRAQLESLAPVPVTFTLTFGDPPYPEIRVERVFFRGRINPSLTEFTEGLLGGALPMTVLSHINNPYCRNNGPANALCKKTFVDDSTLLDLVSTLLSDTPDVDLDGDGLECVLDTDGDSRIDTCCDGAGSGSRTCKNAEGTCNGPTIPPTDPSRPWTCAFNAARLTDGYSVAISFSAVRASIVGVGQ